MVIQVFAPITNVKEAKVDSSMKTSKNVELTAKKKKKKKSFSS